MKFFALLGIFAMAQIVEVSVGVKTVLCYLDLGNSHIAAVVAHTLVVGQQTGSCSIEYGFVLDDLLTNYERVCDHCSNVAVAQIEVAQDSFDTHAYLNDLRHGNDTKESEEFHRRLGRYRERYLFPDGQTAEEN